MPNTEEGSGIDWGKLGKAVIPIGRSSLLLVNTLPVNVLQALQDALGKRKRELYV
jgi:hypothetical protein